MFFENNLLAVGDARDSESVEKSFFGGFFIFCVLSFTCATRFLFPSFSQLRKKVEAERGRSGRGRGRRKSLLSCLFSLSSKSTSDGPVSRRGLRGCEGPQRFIFFSLEKELERYSSPAFLAKRGDDEDDGEIDSISDLDLDVVCLLLFLFRGSSSSGDGNEARLLVVRCLVVVVVFRLLVSCSNYNDDGDGGDGSEARLLLLRRPLLLVPPLAPRVSAAGVAAAAPLFRQRRSRIRRPRQRHGALLADRPQRRRLRSLAGSRPYLGPKAPRRLGLCSL